MVRKVLAGLMMVAALGCGGVALGADGSQSFDAPRLDGIVIDGDGSDWGGRGFEQGIMTSAAGVLRAADDFDVRFRLAWNEQGLLVLVEVADDVAYENPHQQMLWQNDSIELFMAPSVGAADYVQFAVTAGRTASNPEPRQQAYDFRTFSKGEPLTLEAARTVTEHGYVLEAVLPWANLGLTPTEGSEVAFQLFANDSDGGSDRFQVAFYPVDTAHNSSRMHSIRLTRDSAGAVLVKGWPSFQGDGRFSLALTAPAALAGKKVVLKDGKATAAKAVLEAAEGRAAAVVTLPEAEDARSFDVLMGKRRIGTVSVDDAERVCAQFVMESEVVFHPFVFTTVDFPACDFKDPAEARRYLGDYTIAARFYDEHYREVVRADSPGRYGAIVEVTPSHGAPFRRYRTLCRLAGDLGGWPEYPGLELSQVSFPEKYGVLPERGMQHADGVARYLGECFVAGFAGTHRSAELMGTLLAPETGDMALPSSGGAQALDRQWWVGLKRRLSGAETRWSEPLVCPQPMTGPPAPVLRLGSELDAGMKPGTAGQLDGLLTEWAADSDQGFAVCLARNGVVFLHKAYGMRNGAPMTVDTPSWMASITKLLSGTLMMMCVDRGLVDLDAPVSTYLPALHDDDVKTPLTVRDLYTHTNGFSGHFVRGSFGDYAHDLEEIAGGIYPFLNIHAEHLYNGVGYALGGKVIETVSGEAVPLFFEHHLIGPLGCTHTVVDDTSAGARSVPMDIAKIGQMLLNKGAYGNQRFFSEATFEKQLPRPIEGISGPSGQPVTWGIGTVWFPGEGLGEGTFAHGAASGATFRIDPQNNLVIVMTRNDAGLNIEKYHKRFLDTVTQNIDAP